MDEQPESGWTRLHVAPVPKTDQQQFVMDPYTGTLDTEVGCCGFPRPARVPEDDDTDGGPDDCGPAYLVSMQESPSHRQEAAGEDAEAGAGGGLEPPAAGAAAASGSGAAPGLGGTVIGRPASALPVAGHAGPSPASTPATAGELSPEAPPDAVRPLEVRDPPPVGKDGEEALRRLD
mmetsp:Transcript_84936/g.253200  ORF Transcript_84936/g.253200 Transcript_84936/m.253200 type:complete len:177 (+) Transcript_84936:3-533(+)